MKLDFHLTLELAMPYLHLTLFGSFGAMVDGEPVIGFESNKVRALLTYLAVESAQPHTRSALAGLFWPECPERQARQCLSQALYNLRHILGETQRGPRFLLATPQTIQFNPHSDHGVDVFEFTHAIQHPPNPSNTQYPISNTQLLSHALTLYTAPFLHEFALKDSLAFEEWVLITRERLHRLALHALQTLATDHETRGELTDALRYAHRAVELDPLWEAAHRKVMHLLALSGARTQALAQYESLRQTLADALGVEPELETQKLYTQLQIPSPTDIAPPRHHNLPAFLTPFIGREHELDEVTARLRDPDCRLLTILGPGGSGKTRFAVEAARGVMDAFSDGVWFISLASVTTPEGIIPALVRGLGVYLQENVPAERQVQDYLCEKRLLLVLDNYEHLLPEVGWPVQTLREAAGVKLLITSRAPLEVKGEHHYPLAGLALPRVGDTLSGARFSAVQLFVDAAQRASPSFTLTGTNLPAVVDICRAVDGLPLGVILAAAWAGSYSPDEILTEMRRDLDFLATTWADVPERQRSLRATFAYSWRLLSDPERAVMRALAVFRGGFTREAAREVGGATARGLLTLANKSLVQSTSNGRFYLHELVRQFARERLEAMPEEAQAAYNRHSMFFLTKLEAWGTGLKGPHQREVLEEMDSEAANLRAAWNWAVEQGDWESLAIGVEGLGLFYSRRERVSEGLSAFHLARTILEAVGEKYLHLLALLLVWECRFTNQHEPFARNVQACQAILNHLEVEELQTGRLQAHLWYVQGYDAMNRDVHAAKALLTKSVQLARFVNDLYLVGMALLVLCDCIQWLGLLEELESTSQEALSMQRQLGNSLGMVTALRYRAGFLLRNGHPEEAIELEEEALALAETTGVISTGWAGTTYLSAGQLENARVHYQQALAKRKMQGNQYLIAMGEGLLGVADFFLGNYGAARQGFSTFLAYMQAHQILRPTGHVLVFLGMLALAEGDQAQAFQQVQSGVTILREQGILTEWEFPVAFLACAAYHTYHFDIAQEAVCEGLTFSTKVRGSPYLGWSLAAAALLTIKQGNFAKAVFLYASARKFPMTANAHFTEAIFGKEILTAANEHLTPEEIAEAEVCGRMREPFEVAWELLENLKGTHGRS